MLLGDGVTIAICGIKAVRAWGRLDGEIDGRPGRWLISLGNRQIVKSTANADWQQKAGSWSAQRVAGGSGVEYERSVARLVLST